MSSSPLRAKKTLIQNMFSSGDAPPRTPPFQCCVVGGDRFRVRKKRSSPSVAHYSTNFNIELGGARGSSLKLCVLRDERFFRSGRNGNQQNCEFALVQTHMRTFARCAGQAGPGRATLKTTPIADAPSWILSRATLTPACRGLPPRWPKKCSK